MKICGDSDFITKTSGKRAACAAPFGHWSTLLRHRHCHNSDKRKQVYCEVLRKAKIKQSLGDSQGQAPALLELQVRTDLFQAAKPLSDEPDELGDRLTEKASQG